MTPRFACVQLDVPGHLGLDDGRYLLRGAASEEPETVVVVQTLGGTPAGGRRRQRPRPAAPPDEPPEVPVTRLTVIPAEPSEPDGAARELQRISGDLEAAESRVAAALGAVNSVLRAHRVATADPYGHEIGREAVLVARVGYGSGDGLAEGRWEEAVEVAPPARRRRRAEALRPQERLAAVLARREPIDVCETLLLRARADFDQERPREAALQLRAGLEALLAEVRGDAGSDQAEDLAALRERLAGTVEAAGEALAGELDAERTEELAETLAVCERVLRRRQILRPS
ncbi:MAG TPA: hypothetical protein VN458_12305 [Solirubrobacterales bacterium]|nr:hypothetical protein [Solirubrobacterales bacterium]